MLRAVTFDMDDTLRQVHPFPPQLRFMELCAAAGIALSNEQALAAVRARKRFHEDRKARREPANAAWSFQYARVGLEAAGVPGDLDQLSTAVRDARRRMPAPSVLDPDVPKVLERLRSQGFLLGVVSNWGANLAEAMASYGIAQYFASIVDSVTAGVSKPDPAIYRMACAQMGVAPGECVHVGDSVVDDVGVARAAGAVAVLYDPLDDLDAGCPRIHRLMHLLALV